MLTIWGRLNSHNVKKVCWFARELGVDFVRHDVGGKFGMDAAYLAKNPNALIPTIEDGDLVLWESNAILRYMAAQYGDERWWPADPATRALSDRWMDWQFSFADAQRDLFLGLVRTPEAERDHDAMARSATQCVKAMRIVEAELTRHAWLSGKDIGLGDIPMGVYAHTFFALPFDKPELPRTRQWYEALQQRPGYGENVMIPLT